MDRLLFERNLLALAPRDSGLCARLSSAQTTLARCRFIEARSGETVPAWTGPGGSAHPLHSLIDPRREGQRLIATLGDEGFLVFLGLGGGYAVEAALQRRETCQVLVIDYDINGMAELFSSRDYIPLLRDPRFSLLVDPSPENVERRILQSYKPAFHGGIRSLPLRARTALDEGAFIAAGGAIKAAIEGLSADYSVQAHFGKRWFANILRNLFAAERETGPWLPQAAQATPHRAAVIAAGPSLDGQLPALTRNRRELFIIAADTALPCLLHAALEPDAVVSIDCQHISYYHFLGGMPRHIPLFLDLASPPLLGGLSERPRFFTGGHPLGHYISRRWRPLPAVDTSGANVTYAALDLAETLGAQEIELYGADFSYPRGQSYARGTYLFSHFAARQGRFSPLETLFSAFLYRSPSLERRGEGARWYYETPVLRGYRERLEAKIPSLRARVRAAPGQGAPIAAGGGRAGPHTLRLVSPGKAAMGAGDFLARYGEKIRALPPLTESLQAYLENLQPEAAQVFTTLLPTAAALRSAEPELSNQDLLETLRSHCLKAVEKALNSAGN